LSFPQADVGVIGAFGGLGVDVVRIFDETAAVGTHIAELAVLADIDLVFADVPQVFESWFIDGFFQSGIFNVTEALSHGWTVLDVAVGINADFAVEAGVVVLGFGEKGEIVGEMKRMGKTTICKRKSINDKHNAIVAEAIRINAIISFRIKHKYVLKPFMFVKH
jgi:hypothetical protein